MNNNNKSGAAVIYGGQDWPEFNRTPFEFRHSLADSPLLTLTALREVARDFVSSRSSGKISVFEGNKGRTAKWADWDLDPFRTDRLDAGFESIRERGRMLVVIHDIERDPRYGDLLARTLTEVRQRIPESYRNQITWPSAYFFIAAPGFHTPYHMDHEVGLLLQIHGTKELYVYDGSNRSILSEQELEQYYVGNLDAATLRDEFAAAGRRFDLVPGNAAHFPAHSPHWVRNGEDYSISLSINFCLHSLDRAAPIYQANHFLRKLGATPTPPGVSRLRDFAKRGFIDLLSKKHPATKAEMLRSGVERLYSAAGIGRRSLGLLTGRTTRRSAVDIRRQRRRKYRPE